MSWKLYCSCSKVDGCPPCTRWSNWTACSCIPLQWHPLLWGFWLLDEAVLAWRRKNQNSSLNVYIGFTCHQWQVLKAQENNFRWSASQDSSTSLALWSMHSIFKNYFYLILFSYKLSLHPHLEYCTTSNTRNGFSSGQPTAPFSWETCSHA